MTALAQTVAELRAEALADVEYANDPQDGEKWTTMRGYRMAKGVLALLDALEAQAKEIADLQTRIVGLEAMLVDGERERERLRQAIREPSEGMVEAGRSALSQGDAKLQTHARVMWVWQAMIDVALAEGIFAKKSERAPEGSAEPSTERARIAELEEALRKAHARLRTFLPDTGTPDVSGALDELDKVRSALAGKDQG